MILAIDTTGEWGSIALVQDSALQDGQTIEEQAIHAPDGFAHVLFQSIEGLLARHGVKLSDIEAFASASGPGSFTGVRVGLTAAKGLAEGTGRKVIAVSNLQALASFGTRPLRAPVIDARRGEIFGAVYDAALNVVQEEVIAPFPQWLANLPAGDIEIVSNGFLAGAAAGFTVDGTAGGTVSLPAALPVVEAPRSLAAAVGRIAARRLARGGGSDPAEIDANYVRRSDAERFWVDRPV